MPRAPVTGLQAACAAGDVPRFAGRGRIPPCGHGRSIVALACPACGLDGEVQARSRLLMQIRPARVDDVEAVLALHRRVARIPGGLARLENEVTGDHVAGFMDKALARGLARVAVDADGVIRGEIHAARPELFCFAHVLTDLTIAVDPSVQGAGIGRRLFEAFMSAVVSEHPDVLRVELVARESNARALGFYATLGFVVEGRFTGRIRNPDGALEADIPMGWVRSAS